MMKTAVGGVTMGGNFTFRLSSGKELGYTIDADQVIPEGFFVNRRVRIRMRGSDVDSITQVTDLQKIRYKDALELYVHPKITTKEGLTHFVDTKDIEHIEIIQ